VQWELFENGEGGCEDSTTVKHESNVVELRGMRGIRSDGRLMEGIV
jgi:hypothetical protein